MHREGALEKKEHFKKYEVDLNARGKHIYACLSFRRLNNNMKNHRSGDEERLSGVPVDCAGIILGHKVRGRRPQILIPTARIPEVHGDRGGHATSEGHGHENLEARREDRKGVG